VTRVDDDLMAAAKLLGGTMSRSAAQQLSHWARIGLELERSAAVSHADIVAVLSGRRDYDQLSDEEQAVVRAEWAQRLAARIDAVDLRETWAERGQGYVGLDDDGNIVHHAADGTTTAATGRAPARRPAPRRTAASTTTPNARRRVAAAPTKAKTKAKAGKAGGAASGGKRTAR
jgi:hypothetical protein